MSQGFGISPKQQIPVDGRNSLHFRSGHGLNQSPAGEAGHAHGTGGARADQHNVRIEQTMDSDAGVKQAVAKAQLHEHQNSGEADACQSNR